jgi:hemolysin activation/secretion protein
MKRALLASVGASVLFVAHAAAAQDAISNATRLQPPQNVGSAAGSLITDQQRPDRAPIVPQAQASTLQQAAPVVGLRQPAQTAVLRSVKFEGSTIPDEDLYTALSAFEGKPVTNELLQALANAVTAAYAKSNIALFNVYIPPQTLAEGQVTVQVTEGSIGQVILTGDVKTRHLRLLRKYAAKLAEERPLTRATLERYLSLIRDIPGLKVVPALTGSKTPGVQVLTLDIDRTPYRAQLTFDDRGIARLGRIQAQAQFTAYSVFQQGDQTVISVAAPPLEVSRFQFVSIAHSTPIGADGLRLGGNFSYLRTRPKDSVPGRNLTGTAKTAGINLSYPIKRSYNENLYVTASLDGQDADNAAFSQTFSSDHSRAVRLAGSWSKQAARNASSVSLSVSQGVDILSATVDSRLTDKDYRKLNILVARNQALTDRLIARVKATAQLSEKRLPNVEQFTLGGEQFGRAFATAYLLGDEGVAVSGELAYITKAILPRWFKSSEVYGFGDWGQTTFRERVGFVPRTTTEIASVGMGARFNYGDKIVFNVEGATAVEKPESLDDAWRFSFGWRSLF